MDTAALVELYRTASVALDEYFCNGAAGRDKKDHVYQYVVEGRDVPSEYTEYSSCADRAHAKLWRLGCRLPFVNRSHAQHGWRVGQNITLLHSLPEGSPCLSKVNGQGQRYDCPPDGDWVPAPGAEMLIWNSGNDAHSLSILSYDGTTARTANYGTEGMSAASFPGCKDGSEPLSFNGTSWHYGSKVVQRVLTMEGIVAALTEVPDLTDVGGTLLEGMSEVLDAIAALRAAP